VYARVGQDVVRYAEQRDQLDLDGELLFHLPLDGILDGLAELDRPALYAPAAGFRLLPPLQEQHATSIDDDRIYPHPDVVSPFLQDRLLLFARLLHGPHEVLHVPAWVSLRPLVHLFGPPLGLFERREPGDFPFPEEHYRDYLVTGLSQESSRLDPRLFCLLTSVVTMP
jgi:hypothetical protein